MGAGDPNDPAVQAQALTAYNGYRPGGPGDPNYVRNVNQYRPGLSPTDPARQVTTYQPQVAQPQQPGAPGDGRVQVASVKPTQMQDVTTTPPTPGVQPPAQQQPGQQQTATTTPQRTAVTDEAVPPPGSYTPLQQRILRSMGPTATTAEIGDRMAQFERENQHARDSALTRQRQAQKDAEEAARHAREEQRQIDAARRAGLPTGYKLDDNGNAVRMDGLPPDPAVQKAADDAKEAAKSHKGTSVDAQDISILEDPDADPGSQRYAAAYRRQASPKFLPDGSKIVPDMSSYTPPTYKAPGADSGGMTRAPVQPPAAVVDGMLNNVAAVRQVNATLAELERGKGAGIGVIAGNTPAVILNRTSPEGVKLRALIADIGSLKIHDRSGASVTASESPRLMPFIPSISDDAPTARTKLEKFRAEYLSMLNDTYRVYGPSAGGKALEPVEEVLKNAPQQEAQIKSDTEYDALPSGAFFTGPDGVRRRKP
jgi:hypothetical protein